MLAALLRGRKELEPVLGAGSIVTGITVLMFAFNVYSGIKASAVVTRASSYAPDTRRTYSRT